MNELIVPEVDGNVGYGGVRVVVEEHKISPLEAAHAADVAPCVVL